MKRWEIIQHLINKYNFKSYLEIGAARRQNFDKIECAIKDGVDPRGHCNHPITSDKFFSKTKRKYNIIFIDGLHIEDQVDKDIQNSLKHLTKKGIIVMHDCNPPSLKHQAIPREQKVWNGTVWKSFVKLRCTEPNLYMCVVDTDWGCGIIKKGKQELYNKDSLEKCLDWEYFKTNKKELLNLISIKEFVS